MPNPGYARIGRHRPSKYPALQMGVGDSFFVPAEPVAVNGIRATVANLVASNRRRGTLDKAFRIASRYVEEGGAKGLRFWRVA